MTDDPYHKVATMLCVAHNIMREYIAILDGSMYTCVCIECGGATLDWTRKLCDVCLAAD